MEDFIRTIGKLVIGDVRDPLQVSRAALARALRLNFIERDAIEEAEIEYWRAKGKVRRFKGKELPDPFTLRTVGCIDTSDKELSAHYRCRSAERNYLRKIVKQEKKRAMLQQMNEPTRIDVHAVTKARADARDQAILKRLGNGPMTYDELSAALARDPAYARVKAPEQRRQAIKDRVKILRQRDRIEVDHVDGKNGLLMAVVSIKNPAET